MQLDEREYARQSSSDPVNSAEQGSASPAYSKPQGRALIVAYHFPPQAGSSGLLRALKFCRYLPEFGWQPTVLTISPRAYERTNDSQMAEIPTDVEVIRALGLDTGRHLSMRGAYLKALALPDRWSSWLVGGVLSGLRAIRRHNIDVIYTTYPIATAVLIGYVLHRITDKPWIVDFRDSMTEDEYPQDPLTRRVYRWIERKAVQKASALLFTTRGTIHMYLQRYPELDEHKCVLLPNGYDEPDFDGIISQRRTVTKTRLLHSGLIYPWERDPRPFFRALAKLKSEGKISEKTFCIDLRACGLETEFRKDVDELGIADLIHFLPALPYRDALRDAANSDALLLMQAECCDHQVPAKAYEYLRLNKPILALTTMVGDTAALLNEAGGATIVDLADENAICEALPNFLQQVCAGTHPLPSAATVKSFSRRSQADRLAHCLQEVLAKR